jgi:predicted GIY-YIG superfamily endonuclease
MITRRYRNSREAEFEYMMYEYDYRSNNLASHDPNVSAGPFAVVKERARRTMFMLSQFIFRLKKVMRYILEKHTIYVLQLEQGKYYVGSTSHRRQRHRQHFDSSRGGSAFTRLYRPVRVCAEYRRVPRKYYLAMEVSTNFTLTLISYLSILMDTRTPSVNILRRR